MGNKDQGKERKKNKPKLTTKKKVETMGTFKAVLLPGILAALLLGSASSASAASPRDEKIEERIGQVITSMKIMASTLEAMVTAAEGASDCAALFEALNTWARKSGGQLPYVKVMASSMGLLPSEARRREVIDVDTRFKAARGRWEALPIRTRCETDEAFPGALSQDFMEAFGAYVAGVEDLTLGTDVMNGIGLVGEALGLVRGLASAMKSEETCAGIAQAVDAWHREHGKQFQAIHEKGYKATFRRPDSDTPQAFEDAVLGDLEEYEKVMNWVLNVDNTCEHQSIAPTPILRGFDDLMLDPYLHRWGQGKD